ncbi:uncharacterized protein ACHE_50504A [Aspergillus chevalieri]|uniref:Cystathionine gamma-synthase n=1 Tax=Aspergillus chevalieri TaxID=182096 RepID=A0A7R7VR67_ASPCH|nr:uncharacterized protein ACHE_50504A [Aspergillus chevalieri]BCR89306.1 hypothetical protein ACHE_50504A [Aspergillus chevalieri]
MSSRHGEFCKDRINFMHSSSSNSAFQTAAPYSNTTELAPAPWTDSARHEKQEIKKQIAELVMSEKPGSKIVSPDDVFLYSKGMVAINYVARALLKTLPGPEYNGAVVYGWPYAETPKAVEMAGFERFTLYGRGTARELDELEALLKSGQRIRALFCEVPCNPLLESSDLLRVRALADEYGFVVACDETLGTFVNIDLLPYVDVLVTSLTKIFSGASNVMGGSVVVNPQSQHHGTIHSALKATFEDEYFPLDAITMSQNSSDFVSRVHHSNTIALSIANLLSSHPSIHHVHYPTMVTSAPLYEHYRRRDGGYGFLLSMIFNHTTSAVCFYDALDVCKGPSVGTNFTLAIPYAQLAHFQELDFAAEYGVDRYIVRISVGLEDGEVLMERMREALRAVERLEGAEATSGHAKS